MAPVIAAHRASRRAAKSIVLSVQNIGTTGGPLKSADRPAL